jgi:tetratricopeptide (TPR) repeat protein
LDRSARGRAISVVAMLALGWGWFKHIETLHPEAQPDPQPVETSLAKTSAPTQPATPINPTPEHPTLVPPAPIVGKSEGAAGTIIEALSLIDHGSTSEGIALLERLSAIEPNNTEVLMELAMAYTLDLKNPLKARTALEKIVDINPNYRAALSELELVYCELGLVEQGLAFIDLKIQQNPDAKELQFLYGKMLAISDPEAAIVWLKNSTAIIDIREDVLNHLAMAALSTGNLQLAIKSWSESLAIAENALSDAKAKGETALDFLEDRIASTKIDLEKAQKTASKNF